MADAPKPTSPHALQSTGILLSLRACQMFRGLPDSDLGEIASFAQIRRLRGDEFLFREGEPAIGFYVVRQGAINVHRVSAAGKEQVIQVFRPGESFAEAALASATGYPADARAVGESSVIVVPKADFLGLVANRPDLALRMLSSMSQHLRVLVGHLDDLTLKDAGTRLAYWLIKRCPKPLGLQPATVKLSTTKRVLAAELGITAETLSRTLADFRQRALVTVKGNVITVTRPVTLSEVLEKGSLAKA